MYKCKDCGAPLSRKTAKRCVDCYRKSVAAKFSNGESLESRELNSAIVHAIKEELSKIPAPPTAAKESAKSGDTLVIHLSDLHAGKEVKDQDGKTIYNGRIFKERINIFISQVLKLLDNNIVKGVPITDAVILSTGDNANGENIYETQVYEQELTPPRQVMLVVETYCKLIKALLARGLKVSFYGCKGNHGRLSKEADPASNWDAMSYLVLDYWSRAILKSNKFSIRYSEETDYLTLSIRGHRYLIRHIAPEQGDSPAGRVKINEWARTHKVDAVVYGHWHHFAICDVDGIRVFRGGSLVGGDSLSESMAKSAEPIQLVWGVNEDRVSTFIYAVDLGGE